MKDSRFALEMEAGEYGSLVNWHTLLGSMVKVDQSKLLENL